MICEGQPIFLEGANQTVPGLYIDVFTAANGCDSTLYTTLSFLPPAEFEQTLTICENSTVTVAGNVYYIPGVYIDTLVSANGCDSIITTNLFVDNTLTTNISETICQGTSYSFDGNTLTTSGTYVDSLVTSGGCDSVVTLYLFVTPTITYTEGVTICQGQSYTLGSQTLTMSGEYTEAYSTSGGCDSLVTIYLTVSNQIENNIYDTICEGESYVLGTQTLTTTGMYEEVFQTAGGCDSLVSLNLIVQDCEVLLEISNICTPNNDGANDTWKVSDIAQIAGCDVQIFNRWGQMVFETKDYQNDWAGTREGQPLPDGIYYYVIGCDGESEYKGVINLMRFKK
jgi:gliding motility-associated-like protein